MIDTVHLLQIAAAASQTSPLILTSITVSVGSLATGIGGLMKASRWQGRFEEFRENILREQEQRRNDEKNVVQRHELQGLEKHIDARFDMLSRQIEQVTQGRRQHESEN